MTAHDYESTHIPAVERVSARHDEARFLYHLGERFVRYIGDNGIKVVTRLMGPILAVIGVQMVIQGVEGVIGAFLKSGGA